jgi:hypothetical protein
MISQARGVVGPPSTEFTVMLFFRKWLMAARDDQTTDRQGTLPGILARIWWMLFGNAVLALSLIFILRHEGGFFHSADGVFWVVVATLILVRYLDVKFWAGQTATGRYASMTDWLRYVVLLLACSVVLWGIAHGANYLSVGRIMGS